MTESLLSEYSSLDMYVDFIMLKKVKWSHYRPGVAQRVGRGIALLFHDRSTRRGWVVSSTPRSHFIPAKDAVPILQETGWVPGPVWMGGKSRPHRDSIPDRPAHSQSLYRLSNLTNFIMLGSTRWGKFSQKHNYKYSYMANLWYLLAMETTCFGLWRPSSGFDNFLAIRVIYNMHKPRGDVEISSSSSSSYAHICWVKFGGMSIAWMDL